MWLGDMAGAVRSFERAYGEFCRRADTVNAVLVAMNLSLVHHANYGNRAAAAGWAARASRLADGVPVLEGWAAFATAANSEDPEEAGRLARRARAVAVEAGDRDLELCAMSIEGSAVVDAGLVGPGTALLDEALAGAIGGEVASPDTVVITSCLMMQCCVRGADFGRVVEWSRALDGFVERFGSPYLAASCRAHYGAVLVATGDWARAEMELTHALELAGMELVAVRAEAASFLADLRLAQGRLDDARRAVDGLDAHPQGSRSPRRSGWPPANRRSPRRSPSGASPLRAPVASRRAACGRCSARRCWPSATPTRRPIRVAGSSASASTCSAG